MSPQNLFIASHQGHIHYYDWEDLTPIHRMPTRAMGIAKKGKSLYVADKCIVRNLDVSDPLEPVRRGEIFLSDSPDLDLHQMNIVDRYIWIVGTRHNTICQVKLDLSDFGCFPILKSYKHINSIWHCNGLFYVNMAQYHEKRDSGVLVFNSNWELISEFKQGRHAHHFCLVDNQRHVLYSQTPIDGKMCAGLLVGGEPVIKLDGKHTFLKCFSADKDYYYLVGGAAAPRSKRKSFDGHLFLLSRDYELLEKVGFRGTGGFNGCVSEGRDLART